MIVKMKKARIVALKENKEQLLRSLQRYGVLMLIPQDEHQTADTSAEEGMLQRTQNSLKIIQKYQEKQGLTNETHVIDYDRFVGNDPKRQALLDKIEHDHEEIDRLHGENQALSDAIAFFQPWIGMEVPLSELTKQKHAIFHTGWIPSGKEKEFAQAVKDFGGEIQILGKAAEGQAAVFAVYYEDDARFSETMKNLGYIEVSLPAENMTVEELIAQKEKAVATNTETISQIEENLKNLAEQADEIRLYSDQIATEAALKKAPAMLTIDTVYLEGWVRADQTEKLKKAISGVTDIFDLELTDPEDGEMPPTYTKNNKLVEPFEIITDMFSKPNPYEADPNPVMSFWYLLIFGMMMADAGYGLLMAVFFGGMIKIMKPKGNTLKLMKLLLYASVTTAFWGIMFGSYFGATWNVILLEPMKDLTDYLILSLVIGALHVITGLLIQAYDNIRTGHFMDAVFDQFSWMSIIIGIGLLFVPATLLPNGPVVGKWMAVTGSILVVLFAKRQNRNIFSRIGGGLYALYGVSGYLSDILSYSRILALSLSGAVIGMVMNLLAGMLQGNAIGFVASLFVYVVGHIFNLAMGLLGAYVHDCRLQYIEFFSKFYEGGGYEFKPLSLQLHYVDAISDQGK